MKAANRQFVWFICIALFVATTRVSARTVALWLFDDPPGSHVAVDSSGNGQDLTIGAGAAIVEGGRFGNALDADAGPPGAIGAYRDHVDGDLNPGDTSWTLECWLKAKPGMSADNRIWGLSGTNYIDYGRAKQLHGLFIANNFLPAGGRWGWRTGELDADQNWHHIAVVYDAKEGKLKHFYDGKLMDEAPCRWRAVEFNRKYAVLFPPQFPQLQVGMRDPIQQWDQRELHGEQAPRKRFNGYIDELRFSDDALYSAPFQLPASFAKPFLRVSPLEISIVLNKDDKASTQPSLSISSGTMPLDWSAQATPPWLKLSATKGKSSSTPQPVVVTADPAQLASGPNEAEIIIAPQGTPQEPIRVKVKVMVLALGAVIEIGDRRQLMIDHRFIEHEDNLHLQVNSPEKIALDFPSQKDTPISPSNVIYLSETKKWRMYYNALARGKSLRFVDSEDGVHWTVPTPDNVAVFGADNRPLTMAGIMYDPHDAPERRFKAFNEQRGKEAEDVRGIYAYYSADGVHFTQTGRVLPMPAELTVTACWDARIGKYVAYLRSMNSSVGEKNMQGTQILFRADGSVTTVNRDTLFKPGFENMRAIGRVETDDLLKPWPYNHSDTPTIYTTAKQIPMVLSADTEDGFVDLYTAAPWIYPYADDAYFAYPAAFRHFHASRQPDFNKFSDANGPIEIQLASSRDGVHWERYDHAAYIPQGLASEQDRWLNMMGVGGVRVGDWIYQYYWSPARLHDSVLLRPEMKEETQHGGQLFAVRQRLDGFVSADVDYHGGSFSTPAIRFSGGRLLLNHDCNATGTIYVELRDANDVPIPGYTLAESEETACNDTNWEVRWRDKGADVSELAGKPVQIYFRMNNAKLYAFQFAPAAVTAPSN